MVTNNEFLIVNSSAYHRDSESIYFLINKHNWTKYTNLISIYRSNNTCVPLDTFYLVALSLPLFSFFDLYSLCPISYSLHSFIYLLPMQRERERES